MGVWIIGMWGWMAAGFGGCALAGEEEALRPAFAILAGTGTGAKILDRARLRKVPVVLGDVSKTEMVATRTGEGLNQQISTRTKVLVANGKEPVFQALDLAHELVHATAARPNPFDPKLDPASYVRSGIEGQGGEAVAIRTECQVGRELVQGARRLGLKEETVRLIQARCSSVWKASVEPAAWIESFYHLGRHHGDFVDWLRQLGLPGLQGHGWSRKVAAKSPLFSSAVTHKPYPLALLEEYVEITKKVCGRRPASVPRRSVGSSAGSSAADWSARCAPIRVSSKP